MTRRCAWFIGAGALGLFVIGFYIGFATIPRVVFGPAQAAPGDILEAGSVAVQTGVSEQVLRLDEDATFVSRYVFPDSSETVDVPMQLPPAFAGLSEAEIRKMHPDWQIEKFGTENLVVRRQCGALSGEEGFLGVYDGMVAVFAGTPNSCHRLRQVIPIRASRLTSFQLEDLRRNIHFADHEELQQILEGLLIGY